MKKYLVLSQYCDWHPSVERIFDVKEDALIFCTLLRKTNTTKNKIYSVFEQTEF